MILISNADSAYGWKLGVEVADFDAGLEGYGFTKYTRTKMSDGIYNLSRHAWVIPNECQ